MPVSFSRTAPHEQTSTVGVLEAVAVAEPIQFVGYFDHDQTSFACIDLDACLSWDPAQGAARAAQLIRDGVSDDKQVLVAGSDASFLAAPEIEGLGATFVPREDLPAEARQAHNQDLCEAVLKILQEYESHFIETSEGFRARPVQKTASHVAASLPVARHLGVEGTIPASRVASKPASSLASSPEQPRKRKPDLVGHGA